MIHCYNGHERVNLHPTIQKMVSQIQKKTYLSPDFRVGAGQPHTCRTQSAIFTLFCLMVEIQGCPSNSFGIGRVDGFRANLRKSYTSLNNLNKATDDQCCTYAILIKSFISELYVISTSSSSSGGCHAKKEVKPTLPETRCQKNEPRSV